MKKILVALLVPSLLFGSGVFTGGGGGGGGGGNLDSINSDTTAAQTISIGTSGNDVNIADDAAGGHVIHVPDAAATKRGVVTTGSQTFAGTKTFSSTITGSISGNAGTATALASNPSDCASDTYATTIAASGNLTCAAITNASTTAASANTASAIVARDGSGNFSAGTITASLTGNASTATALAANPADCGAGQYASAIAANGDLTCSTPSAALPTGVDNHAVRYDGTTAAQSSAIVISDVSGGYVSLTQDADSDNNATAATGLLIEPADKTAGTGAGGPLVLRAGNSSGGSYGLIQIQRPDGAGGVINIDYSTNSPQILAPQSVIVYSFQSATTSGMSYSSGELKLWDNNVVSLAVDSGYIQPNGDIVAIGANQETIGAYNGTTLIPFQYAYFGQGISVGTQSGSSFTPISAMDTRANASGTAIYHSFTIPTTTGVTSGDGSWLGVDASGNYLFEQKENLPMIFKLNGSEAWRIAADGKLTNKAAGNESTGAGSALLGTNSPAVTNTAPYTWLSVVTSDGSAGFIPVWK